MSKKILITGANGNIGGALVKALSGNTDVTLRLAVRDVEKGRQKHGNRHELVQFELTQPETFDRATRGIDAVFLLGPALVPDLDRQLEPFIDHLREKEIKRVVYISAFGFEHVTEMPFHERTAKKLAEEGFDYTILKPTFFAQNFRNFEWDNITQRNMVYSPAGKGRVAFIDVEDIGRVAAVVLTGNQYSKQVLELTGPELLTYDQVAELLTGITGKKVVYPNPGSEEYKSTLLQAGAPAFIGDYMDMVYSAIRNGYVDRKTDTVKAVTGREPSSLREVLERDFAAAKA